MEISNSAGLWGVTELIGKVRSKQLIQAVLGRGRKSEFSEDLEKDVKVKAGLADKWGLQRW